MTDNKEDNIEEYKGMAITEAGKSPVKMQAKSFAITTDEDQVNARRLREEWKAIHKIVYEEFDKAVIKTRDAYNDALARRERFATPFEEAIEILKEKDGEYQTEKERKIAEANRKAEIEAAEKERKAKEKLAAKIKAAEDKGEKDKAEILTDKLQEIYVAPPLIVPEKRDDGTAYRDYPELKVTDILEFLKTVLEGNFPVSCITISEYKAGTHAKNMGYALGRHAWGTFQIVKKAVDRKKNA